MYTVYGHRYKVLDACLTFPADSRGEEVVRWVGASEIRTSGHTDTQTLTSVQALAYSQRWLASRQDSWRLEIRKSGFVVGTSTGHRIRSICSFRICWIGFVRLRPLLYPWVVGWLDREDQELYFCSWEFFDSAWPWGDTGGGSFLERRWETRASRCQRLSSPLTTRISSGFAPIKKLPTTKM